MSPNELIATNIYTVWCTYKILPGCLRSLEEWGFMFPFSQLHALQVGTNAFYCAQPCVDRVVVVSEKDIALAILRLVEVEKSVVEGAGATGLAACLSGQLDHLQGKK